MKAEDILLTTVDNEFNPFTQYDDWRDFDTDANSPTHPAYCTEAYWMRLLGLRDPDVYSSTLIADELMPIFEEIITINAEIGNDVYEIITREGIRMKHVPPDLLYTTPKEYNPSPGEGAQNDTPT